MQAQRTSGWMGGRAYGCMDGGMCPGGLAMKQACEGRTAVGTSTNNTTLQVQYEPARHFDSSISK